MGACMTPSKETMTPMMTFLITSRAFLTPKRKAKNLHNAKNSGDKKAVDLRDNERTAKEKAE